ncbi:MAG: DNA internalization-related competence protein ComEC/Rec2 [Bacillota bacterium]|nr:DNA internalization-related competence protein ComEC/Rec2 [Bacillota bacterium]
MKGLYFYFSIASLLGILCALKSFLFFFILAIIYLVILFKYKRFSRLQLICIAFVYILFYFSTQIKITHYKTKIPVDTNTFYITFNQDPKIDGDSLQILVKEIRLNEKILLHYRIRSEMEKQMLEKETFYGRKCEVIGELKSPQIAKNENEFNYKEYLYQNQIYWILESNETPLKKCVVEKPSLLLMLKEIRFKGINYLKVHFPPDIAAFGTALIFGDRSLMSPETLSSFQKAGIVHLLAISGLHVSLLVEMVYLIGIRIGVTKENMVNFLLSILPVYAILAGGAPSVIRAVLMLFLVLCTVKFKRSLRLSSFDAISLAFSFYLFVYPMVIYDVGFQLSFSVSFGIILSAPVILKRYHRNFSKLISTSVVAQMSGLPILLYYFFSSSLMSIISNLIFIPFFSFFLLPGLYLLFFIQVIFGNVPTFINLFFEKVIHFSTSLLEYLTKISIFTFTPGRPNWFFLLIYIMLIVLIFMIWEMQMQYYRKFLVMLGTFLLLFQIVWNQNNPIGEVTMIDVGQGDCILIHLPFGKGNYLIDTGGTLSFNEEKWKTRKNPFEVGKNIVVPYLKSKGITKIDKLILTHGDMDHIGGAFAIIKEIQIKQILIAAVRDPSETENAIVSVAKKKQIPVVKVSAGDHWENRNSYFYVLSPEKNFSGVRNRGSITLFMKIGGLAWFSGGDLDQEGEEAIVKKYPNLSFDILKVGHHGSRTSSSEEFLTRYKPKISLISVGKNNRFGHPNQEVLDKLNNIHSVIYRTDQQGAITYRFFHEQGTFLPFLP